MRLIFKLFILVIFFSCSGDVDNESRIYSMILEASVKSKPPPFGLKGIEFDRTLDSLERVSISISVSEKFTDFGKSQSCQSQSSGISNSINEKMTLNLFSEINRNFIISIISDDLGDTKNSGTDVQCQFSKIYYSNDEKTAFVIIGLYYARLSSSLTCYTLKLQNDEWKITNNVVLEHS